MRLKAEVVEKLSCKITKRETEAAREMRHKNYVLALTNFRR